VFVHGPHGPSHMGLTTYILTVSSDLTILCLVGGYVKGEVGCDEVLDCQAG
jgi:hypothetical protein